MAVGADLVSGHDRPLRIAQKSRVHPGKVSEVREVLDLARRVALPGIRPTSDQLPAAGVELGHLRNRKPRFVARHPDQPAPLDAQVRRDASLRRDPGRLFQLRDKRADPGAVVVPAVIRTDEVVTLHATERKSGPSVDAHVAVGVGTTARVAPDHDRLIEERHPDRSCSDVGREPDRVPAATQRLPTEICLCGSHVIRLVGVTSVSVGVTSKAEGFNRRRAVDPEVIAHV